MDSRFHTETLRLPLRVTQSHGEGPPMRRLVLTCAVTNESTAPICVLHAWIRVESLGGLRLAEGSLFHMAHALAYPPVIAQGAEGTGIITIELPAPVLDSIEHRRSGGDLPLTISSRVLVAETRTDGEEVVFRRPIQTLFEAGRSGEVLHTIPQSEWVKLLRSMAWSEMELLEFPTREIRSDARLARAFKRLEDAQDCCRRGLWEEAVINCRKIFEAMVKDVGGEDSMERAMQVIQTLVSDVAKAQKVNEMVLSVSAFLQLARHEQLPVVTIGPEDAALALHASAALLRYLATA